LTRPRRSRLVDLLDRQSPQFRQSRAARLGCLALVTLLGTLALPPPAAAQDLYGWTVGLMGGVGGSVDVKPGSRSFSNAGYQLEGLALIEPRTQLGLRVGHLDLGGKNTLFGSRVGADLSYVTLAGQYMYEESYYDSGLYLGLGAYRLGGKDAISGGSASKTAAGGVFGVTGEFKATRRLALLIELSAHYIDVRNAHIFAMAHGGLAFHF
jgi:hypothetical protein